MCCPHCEMENLGYAPLRGCSCPAVPPVKEPVEEPEEEEERDKEHLSSNAGKEGNSLPLPMEVPPEKRTTSLSGVLTPMDVVEKKRGKTPLSCKEKGQGDSCSSLGSPNLGRAKSRKGRQKFSTPPLLVGRIRYWTGRKIVLPYPHR